MRVLDLFSGIGGWTLGLDRAGFETVAACEIDPWKRAQYQRLWPNVKVYEDVTRLAGADVVAECGPIDCIVGSPPCKHISSARAGGQQGVDGDGLFFEAVRLVGEIRPRWCAFENSPHLRTRGADRVLSALEALRYACWPLVVGAGNAGAAHRRQRVWVLAWNTEGEQGRVAGQSRKAGRVSRLDRDADLEGQSAISLNDEVALMPGAQGRFRRLGPSGQADIGLHVRAYDGLPAGNAERIKHAYGDAIVPQIATAIGGAMLSAEAAHG